jgi:glycosyltransferase involved in cell wall biosynthesis/predicted O-methyltransferase YrrM
MTIPTVSVILTSYNHEEFIREAIESVLSQSFTDYELIIWDDASTDKSWSIINSYHDGRIRTFRNACNTCGEYFDDALACTQGKYIAIHHSDDGWEPSKLARQVQILDESPDVGACFTHVTAIDELGTAIGDDKNHYTSVFAQHTRSRQEWLRHFFFKGNALCNPSVLIRRECYASIGTFNLGLYQLPDLHLWIRLCLVHEIHIIPEKLVRFRVDTKGMSSQSAPTPANIIRHQHEMIHVLEAYRSIGIDDLLTAFPEAQAFEGIPREDSNIDYMLAMLAVTSTQSTAAQRSFGAHLLTRCWMDSDVRQKLHSIHGLTRHQLLTPEILVDHSNSIQIINLANELKQVSIQLDQCRNLKAPSGSVEMLIEEIRQSNSLSIFKEIQKSIKERSFHLLNHILYDIRSVLGDRQCTYLEIGSYCGASALLMLAHPLETQVLCVDPLNLPPAHYAGTKSQDETLYDNLSKLGQHQNFEVIKSFSQEASLIEALYRHKISIDILFIDGDHSYSAVISDFQIYEPLVASGGYIIFDDYHDHEHSPDVHHAVNELARRYRDDSRFEIIGPIPDLQHCNPTMPDGNEFVIYKR